MEPPSAKRRKVQPNMIMPPPAEAESGHVASPSVSSLGPLAGYYSTILQRRQTNQEEYHQVCIINPDVPNRMQRLRSLARVLNVPVAPKVTADQLCYQISQVLTPSLFAMLPPELVQEIQLHLPSRSVQAMRTAIPDVIETAPSTLQWISQYWNPLQHVGFVPSGTCHYQQQQYAAKIPQDTIVFFDNLSNRVAMEYLLMKYPLFFSNAPILNNTIEHDDQGDGLDYSFFPGQTTKVFTQFSYDKVFRGVIEEVYAEEGDENYQTINVTAIPITTFFPLTTITTAVNNNLHRSNSSNRGAMFIKVIFNDAGELEFIYEYPSECTPGFASVQRLLWQSDDMHAQAKASQHLYTPGEYEALLQQADITAWQQGLYPPKPGEIVTSEYTNRMYDNEDELDADSAPFFQALFDRWTQQGYALAFFPRMFSVDTGLFCFSASNIAKTFITAARQLDLWRWHDISVDEQRDRVARVWPIVINAARHWLQSATTTSLPQIQNQYYFPNSSDDLNGFALVILMLLDDTQNAKTTTTTNTQQSEQMSPKIDTRPFINLALLASKKYQQPFINIPVEVTHKYEIY